ncbi:MAG: DUF5305 family protein [Eubacteriales bacterium]|nr:DUF5305 family protein [Eubacteriales bacterium]
MKKSNFNLAADSLAENFADKNWRKPIHGLKRWLVIFILLLLIGLTSSLAYSFYRPIAILLPTQVYIAERTASIDYQVIQTAQDGASETYLGENQVYISGLTRAIKTDFHYSWLSPTAADLTWSDTVQAALRIREATGEQRILFEEQTPVVPVAVSALSVADYRLDRSAVVELAPYIEKAQAFADQSKIQIVSELVLSLAVKTQADVAGGLITQVDQPELIVPLTSDTFQIQEILPKLGRQRTWRLLPYAVNVLPIPFFIYPAVGAILVSLLILWLVLTRTKRPSQFDRQLRRMQRIARGRLMLISDKAWEPEWCVTASDYQSMVKTARKLKHPIFCYVDRSGETPAAYFYVYYGENNYCLTFRPEGVGAPLSALPTPQFKGQLSSELSGAGEDLFSNEPNLD